LTDWQADLDAGKLTVFMIEECHFLWVNLINYAWGSTSKRIEVPLLNKKEKQTYSGTLDYSTKEFIIKEYATANSENTVNFLNYLFTIKKTRKKNCCDLGWSNLSSSRRI
jgi:DDE superfamily endonuclease